jgi:hypothetical protein
MRIEGRCHCGFITYEAEVDPEKVMICHCTDCQTLSGSAFRSVVLTRESGFKLPSGTLKSYVKTAESGARRPQTFCPECGSVGRRQSKGLQHPAWQEPSASRACSSTPNLVPFGAAVAL